MKACIDTIREKAALNQERWLRIGAAQIKPYKSCLPSPHVIQQLLEFYTVEEIGNIYGCTRQNAARHIAKTQIVDNNKGLAGHTRRMKRNVVALWLFSDINMAELARKVNLSRPTIANILGRR